MRHIDRSEEDILSYEVSDEVLEAAARGRENANAQTHPFAIICIPFGPKSAGQ